MSYKSLSRVAQTIVDSAGDFSVSATSNAASFLADHTPLDTPALFNSESELGIYVKPG